MTYAGTAMGISKAHSNTRLPGKRHMVTIHAVPVPMMKVPRPTPTIKINVVDTK